MRSRNYRRFVNQVVSRIGAEMPWASRTLLRKGSPYVRNYSEEGDAQLTAWPCHEGHVDPIPVGDRHYEYGYVVESFHRYQLINKTVLDVGSAGSPLPIILAALGNQVVCLDVREWPVMWPNVSFIRGDILQSNLDQESFDVITCVSTVEHFGLGRYGDVEDVDGDINGVSALRRFLKPQGLMIITVPFGNATVAFPAHRVYNASRFRRLASGFKVLDKRFFGPIDRPDVYRPCTKTETHLVDTKTGWAVICAVLQKE